MGIYVGGRKGRESETKGRDRDKGTVDRQPMPFLSWYLVDFYAAESAVNSRRNDKLTTARMAQQIKPTSRRQRADSTDQTDKSATARYSADQVGN